MGGAGCQGCHTKERKAHREGVIRRDGTKAEDHVRILQ